MSTAIYTDTDGWEIEPRTPEATEEGFDTMTQKVMVFAESYGDALALFTKGGADSVFENMFVVTVKPKLAVCGLNFYEVDLGFKGLLQDKPAKWRMGTLSERNSYKQVTITGYVLNAAADVAEPRVSVIKRYVTLTKPDMSQVGQQVTPDFVADIPDDIWALIPDGIRNVPKEWVLDARTPSDSIPSDSDPPAWVVDDTFSYYQPVKPAK